MLVEVVPLVVMKHSPRLREVEVVEDQIIVRQLLMVEVVMDNQD
jgi:hypothetical protein